MVESDSIQFFIDWKWGAPKKHFSYPIQFEIEWKEEVDDWVHKVWNEQMNEGKCCSLQFNITHCNHRENTKIIIQFIVTFLSFWITVSNEWDWERRDSPQSLKSLRRQNTHSNIKVTQSILSFKCINSTFNTFLFLQAHFLSSHFAPEKDQSPFSIVSYSVIAMLHFSLRLGYGEKERITETGRQRIKYHIWKGERQERLN